MLLTMMKAKLHRATVTQADVDYEGSIAVDRDLLDASGILPHEQVDVLNITTGARCSLAFIMVRSMDAPGEKGRDNPLPYCGAYNPAPTWVQS